MKKTLLLAAVACATMSASAMTQLGASAKSFELGATKHSMTVGTLNASNGVKLMEDVDLTGAYVGAAVTDDPVNSCGAVVIEANPTAANTYTVYGAFLGLPDAAVTATYADGKLTIPAGQQVYNSSTYGPAALFAIDGENIYDIVLFVEEDGSLVLDPSLKVSMILTTGSYAGYPLGDTYSYYKFLVPNGTCTFDALNPDGSPKEDNIEVYTTSVKLNKDANGNVTSGVVYGFDEMTWLPFTVEEDNMVQFSNDKVYYYGQGYDLAFATDIDEEGHFYTNVGPTGVLDVENGTITMPSWSFILPSTPDRRGNVTYYILNSRKSNCVVTFPAEAKQPKFTSITIKGHAIDLVEGQTEYDLTLDEMFTADDVVVTTENAEDMIVDVDIRQIPLTEEELYLVEISLVKADGSVAAQVDVYVSVDVTTGINDINVNSAKVVKMIENGQVVIVKDGVKYNVAGQAIK